MAALTSGRNTPRREPDVESHPMRGGATIYVGALVMIDAAGWAGPGATSATLKAVGRAEDTRMSVANGDRHIRVRRGVFRWGNSDGADAITRADIGNPAYAVDDQTLAKTSNGGARSAAGIIRDVDAQGVWIAI
ncbi:MAG: hypothetical protein ACK4TC_09315 [Sphingomonas pseudosanguinis]|uniref:hypothetical protein n=1 Tax=Sphingomonas pseudosanguinis TaxID=413712 RepID=UPI00391C5BB9